jgi:hypothetical protein
MAETSIFDPDLLPTADAGYCVFSSNRISRKIPEAFLPVSRVAQGDQNVPANDWDSAPGRNQ